MHPWVPVLVTIALGILGLTVQGFLLAYFLGRMKEHQAGQAQLVATFRDFTEKALDALGERMGAMDKFAAESGAHRAELSSRMGALEAKTQGLPQLGERFAAFEAKSLAHQDRTESDLQRMSMALEGVQRQLAQLAIHGPGQLVQLQDKVKS